MDYELIDDFLPESEFKELENFVYNPNLNLYYQDNISVRTGEDVWTPFFGHKIYDRDAPLSEIYYPVKDFFISKLDIKSLIRSKLNCYFKTDVLVEHSLHTDFDYQHKGAILSLNTCDGFTILDNKIKVKSIRNRVLLFDPSIPHKSTSCTDKRSRWNIIVNYF